MRVFVHPPARPGLSLLEVLAALAIFLISLIGIGRIITLSAERARAVDFQGQAAQLCQAKLAEVVAGAVPLSSQGETAFEEDPAWQWSLECEADNVPSLWKVQVRVSRTRIDGFPVECVLSQMVLDPAQRGSLNSASTPTTTATASATSSGTNSALSPAQPAPTGSGSSSSPSGGTSPPASPPRGGR